MKQKRSIPEAVIQRVKAAGKQAWLEQLDNTIETLERQWHIHVGDTLPGGTHAFVASADWEDGKACVLKIHLPEETGSDEFANEIRFLQAANGSGYVTMYAVDMDKKACLLEHLGQPLSKAGYPVREQIQIICKTLENIWQTPADISLLPDGKAAIGWFRSFIRSANEAHGHPCSAELIDCAMHFLHSREEHLRPENCVLIHGDANAQNILHVPGTENGYKLIDADGLFYEKAYDLGVLMREWRSEYVHDPLTQGIRRCEYLHHLTGADKQAIWEWGFLQCIATALTAWTILPDDAQMLLRIAQVWSRKPVLQ